MLNVTSPPIFQFVHLSLILILTGSTMLIACNKGADNKKNDAGEALVETSSDNKKADGDETIGSDSMTHSSQQDVQSPSNSGAMLARMTESQTNETSDAHSSSNSSSISFNPEPGDEKPIPYDPAVFDLLLKSYVSNGKVDYRGFKSSDEFTQFITSLKTADILSMSTDEGLAFWINAYNGLVILNVNNNPGIEQPLDAKGFFDKKKFMVAGKSVTLNDIENNIVRPTYKEPLIHFGLVCAALSCPPLIRKAYTASNVRSQLVENARAYLANPKQNHWDARTKTLYLSKIFEWYKVDFSDNTAGLIAFAKEYGPESMKSGLEGAGNVKIKFLEYDWTLNKK